MLIPLISLLCASCNRQQNIKNNIIKIIPLDQYLIKAPHDGKT